MISSPLSVAVVLTCYNEGPYIGAAVRSVLEQTRGDLIESIVIADDGSAADTIAVLKEIERRDLRIKVLYGAGGAGLPAQRNLAIGHTAAPLIAILDGDDIWASQKLELQYAKLQEEPDAVLVYSGYSTFAFDDVGTANQAKVMDISSAADLTQTYFLNDPPIIPSTTLFRRKAFDAIGGFDASIKVFEDSDFYLRLSRVGRFAFVPNSLLHKRSRGDSITAARRDLMAYHAFVALKAAAETPRLLALVPRRLAERARKLGNQRFLGGSLEEAHRLACFATQLDPWNWRAWGSRFMTTRGLSGLAYRFIASRAQGRRVSMGMVEPATIKGRAAVENGLHGRS